jgi:hypothetical protein
MTIEELTERCAVLHEALLKLHEASVAHLNIVGVQGARIDMLVDRVGILEAQISELISLNSVRH